MDKFGPMKDARDGETDARGKDTVDGNKDDCFQSLMTKKPKKITIHDPYLINTGKVDLPAKRETTMEITAQKSSVGEKHLQETSPKEDYLRVKGFIRLDQDQSVYTEFLEYPYTQMESKSITEQHQSKMEVQHTDLEPCLGMIEPEGTRMEALDPSLKKTNNKLENPHSSTKLPSEGLTVAVSSSVKGELTPSSLPKRRHYSLLSRSQPYWIPIHINKNLTMYGMFKPEFVMFSEDGNSTQEMNSRDEDDETGRIPDALKVDHIDRPPPEVTLSAYSSVSGQLTIPEMEPNSSEYFHQGKSHEEPLNEMGSAVAVEKATIDTGYSLNEMGSAVAVEKATIDTSYSLNEMGSAVAVEKATIDTSYSLNEMGSAVAVEKATIDTSYSCIPILDETQMNVNNWHTPNSQIWRPKLQDKLAHKKHNGGTKPFN